LNECIQKQAVSGSPYRYACIRNPTPFALNLSTWWCPYSARQDANFNRTLERNGVDCIEGLGEAFWLLGVWCWLNVL
jgi:hypothetical protein